METGEYQIGINPKKERTGKGNAVRIIKVKSVIKATEEHEEDQDVNLFYALGKNMRVYKVEEKDFQKPGYKDETVEAFKAKGEGKGKYQSYLGYDFGEIIPTNVNGYKNMVAEIIGDNPEDISDETLEEGHLVFMGMEPNEDDPDSEELVRICWVLKEEDSDANPMSEEVFYRQDFVKYMLVPMEAPKRMTIHYINKEGEKTEMAVNNESEIKDMDRELYRMNN